MSVTHAPKKIDALSNQVFSPGHYLPYRDVRHSAQSLYPYWQPVLWGALELLLEQLFRSPETSHKAFV